MGGVGCGVGNGHKHLARLCLCGEGRRGGGEREGSSSFNKFPSTQSKTSPTLSTTSSITTSKSMSTDLKPSQSVTTSQQSLAKTKTLLVDVGVDGSGGRVGAGVEMGVASHLFSWTNSSGERRGGMGENIVVFCCCSFNGTIPNPGVLPTLPGITNFTAGVRRGIVHLKPQTY